MSLQPTAVYAANPRVTRGSSTKLDASPDGKKLVYAQGRTVFFRDLDVRWTAH